MTRRRTLWLPALLSSLALLVVIGGVIVGQFYWANLHSNLWRVESSMSRARENQRLLLEQIARTRALLAEQQRGLQAESDALSAARKRLAEERAALEKERSARAQHVVEQARDAKRLREAAALVNQALVAQGPGPTAVDQMLAAAQARLKDLSAGSGQRLETALSQVRERLQKQSPSSRDALVARIQKVRAQAAALAQPRRPAGWYDPRVPPQEIAPAAGSLVLQLDRTRRALDRGDAARYRYALETARFLLITFFDSEQADIAQLAQAIADLEQAPRHQEYDLIKGDLEQLGKALRKAEETLHPGAREDLEVVVRAPPPQPRPATGPAE
jgi:uncharacterized protein HemX